MTNPPSAETQPPKLWYALARIPDRFTSVAYSPDGRRIAAGSTDGSVKIWDAEDGRLLQTLTGHQKSVNSVAYAPDGRRLASGSGDKTIKVWDTQTGRLVQTLEGHQDWVRCIDYSPNGHWLASGSNDKTLNIWDTQTGSLCRSVAWESNVLSLVFSPTSDWVAFGVLHNSIHLL